MTLIVAIVVVAIAAGFLSGGSLRPFERLRVHWWAIAPIGLALQGAPVQALVRVDGDAVSTVVLVVSYVMLLCFAFVNRKLPGALLILTGLAMNVAVIAPNGGMPVDPAAARVAGAGAITIEDTAKHHVLRGDDVLPFLGDVIAVPPPVGVVLSAGDVVLYAGVLAFVVMTMRGLASRNARPPARWFQRYRGKHLPPDRRGLPRGLPLPSPAPAGARWGTAP
jgi:hypothetical protein